ncbi:HtaA domain-containing protein [Microbacterium saccharophilum]|uniref:HtaA domain-containing protein n=1 Tax=Microbacterium saccharophilum TaxID=1213358 RepID=UPI00147889AB|nr:HtaA domain-containing protein [Microbacterium saccharophilum]
MTFTIGAPASAPGGSTGTIATASAAKPAALPATPPATTGIDVDDETLDALQAGGQVTIRVPGFRPNETGIAIVVYSTPILLGTVTADADGVATWAGSLPATLEAGTHTLTFQGSIDRGIVFTLDRAVQATTLGASLAEGASLNWGFEESFRTYLEGIAGGGWQLTDVAYEYPDFVWTSGSGTLDLDARTGLVSYGGGIEFTGHEGVLDTLLSDVRLELAGDVGYLVVDVSGATQSGVEASEKDVRFAEFPLGELTVEEGVLALSGVPATLTEAGAAAFGTYGAGEELDPITARIPVPADCTVAAVPATDDGGAAAAAAAPAQADADESAAPVWPWTLGGLVLLVAVVAVVVARRRRAAGAEPDGTV